MDLNATYNNWPEAGEVAVRAVVLRQLISYGQTLPDPMEFIDAQQSWTNDEKLENENASRLARDEFWSKFDRFIEHLSPKEKEFSQMSLENYDGLKMIDVSWRLEALGTLLWALGYVKEMPAYDEQFGFEDINGAFEIDPDSFFNNAKLRPQAELDTARNEAEAWNWRSRTRQIIEEGTPFPDDPTLIEAGFTSFDDIVRNAAEINTNQGIFTAINEDWPALGMAYRDLSNDDWYFVQSITTERHFTLNWLCGLAPENSWDDTPTDT